jgi:hypothetical protein
VHVADQLSCLDVQDVPVDSLVPASLQDWQPPAGANTADAFIKEMKAFDDDKAAQIKAAVDKVKTSQLSCHTTTVENAAICSFHRL